MKEGWEIKSLEELCDFVNGLWTGKTPPFQSVGVVRNTNFTKDGRLDDSDIVYLNVEKSQFAKRKLQYGDIILEKSGGGPKQPVGRVIIFNKKDGDFSFSNFTSLIRVKDKNEIDFNYLHTYLNLLYLSGRTETMQSHSTGIRNLKFHEYKQIKLPYPPLKEQKHVVELLRRTISALDQAKSNTEKNIQNAKELFKTYLEIVFSNKNAQYENVKLADLAMDITDGDHMPPPKSNHGIPFITISNIDKSTNKIDFSDTFKVSKEYFQKLKSNRVPRKGDVLYTVTGSFGIPVIIESNIEFCFQRHIGLIRPNKDAISKWLYFWILSPQSYKQAINSATGTAQKTVSLTALRNFSIPKMTIPDQQILISNLDSLADQIKELEYKYQQKLVLIEKFRKSVLEKAFAGELTHIPELTTA